MSMPVKAHIASGARHAARRRYYYVAANTTASPAAHAQFQQFFDAGFHPTSSPRLVNSAQITLQQEPSGGGNPSGQQSKSSGSGQPPSSTLVLPLPMGGPGTPSGAGAAGRTGSGAGNGAAAGGLGANGANAPYFFPSILLGSVPEKAQRAPTTFRLQSGAYGIPKTRPMSSQRLSPSEPTSPSSANFSPAPSSSSSLPQSSPGASTSTLPPLFSPEPLDLSCQIGDDAYFVRPNALGVADGVGGWSGRPGANSALFSRRLMHYCSHEVALLYPSTSGSFASPSSPSTPPASPVPFLTPAAILAPLPASVVDVDPVDVLQRAYERTLELSRIDGSLGSSTALVAVLFSSSSLSSASSSSSSPRLRIAHVGDCLIGLIRKDEIVYRSNEQQHRFNYPYQLGTQSQTTPQKDAIRIDLPVQEGDVIVLASDGLGDNLWDEDVLEEAVKWGQDVRGMSEALAKRAKKVSESGAAGGETPFSRRAHEENKSHVGGKADDISVVVAVIEGVTPPEMSPAPSSPAPPYFRRY